jgi:hypothetical protein
MRLYRRIGVWEETGARERAGEPMGELALRIILSSAVSALKGHTDPADAGG